MVNQFFSLFIDIWMGLMEKTRLTRWIMHKWFGLSLYVQLMFGSGLLLILVGTSAALWNISQQQQSMIEMTKQQAYAISKIIADSSAESIQLKDVDLLKIQTQKAVYDPSIIGLAFFDPLGQPLGKFSKQNGGETFKVEEGQKQITPPSADAVDFNEQQMQLLVAIENDAGKQGWLKVTVDKLLIQKSLDRLFLDNSIQAWFSILTQFLMIFFLLFLPAINFKRAQKFATRIHNGQGETIQSNGGAKETTELIEALNATSELFAKQQQEILEINEGLEQKVLARTKELEISKQQTEALIEYSPDAMIVCDDEGKIKRINYQTEQLFGYRRLELIDKSIIDLLASEIDHDFLEQVHKISEMTAAERAINNDIHEYIAFTKFEEQIPIAVNFNAIVSETDHLTVVCSIRDITNDKHQQEQLHNALQQARAADKVKTQFLTTMSHEMRTPMNGVLGMAEMLSHTGLTDKQSSYLNTILDTGGSLLTIINDILDFTQLESGNVKLKKNTINIEEMLTATLTLVKSSADEKNLKLVSAIADDISANIQSDASRIRQVLFHFVGNAVKFTEQGSVTVNVSKTMNSGQAFIRFAVVDTGIGISQNQLDNVFKSFTQGDATTTRQHEGTGMGLAICQQITKLMMGQIGVESEEGKGSVFWFEVPYLEAEEGSVKPKPVKSQVTLDETLTGKVLLVEDNPVNQKVAMALLKKMGLSVEVANDGVEGVDKWQSNDYDIVLMDCLMPNMDGFEATRKIREIEQEKGKHTPISALTANALEDDRKRCKDAGMDDFVSKPINPAMLKEVIEKYVN